MNSNKWKLLCSLVLAAAFAVPALAQEAAPAPKKAWNKEHPRRHEVNKRLNHQNKRAKEGVEDGKLTKQQAAKIHKEDRSVRKEERAMAAKDGGRISKADQRKLNRRENRINRRIKKDAAGAPAPAAPPAK
ncbi:MAG: hypothetical protein KGL74_03840 [Elusimicrobia bacterium]|nr:hypothetical protein [Elusimicrobiota bacterium]